MDVPHPHFSKLNMLDDVIMMEINMDEHNICGSMERTRRKGSVVNLH